MNAKTHCKKGHEYTPENTAFRPRPNGIPARDCRACHVQQGMRAAAKMKSKRKRWYYELLLQSECKDCGEKRPETLHFDHIDPSTKSFSISNGIHDNAAWSKILAEIDKCEVRCANCHAIRTAKQFDWYKDLPDGMRLYEGKEFKSNL